MNTLLFIAWIASGTIHMQGVTQGSSQNKFDWSDLSTFNVMQDKATAERGCHELAALRGSGIDAHLYQSREDKDNRKEGPRDSGWEMPVVISEMICVPKVERSLILRKK